MPQKDDFLTRLQEQLLRALEQARQLGAAGQMDEALAAIHQAQRTLVGLDSDLLHRVPSADLLLLLGGAETPDVERCLHCAELLSAEAELQAKVGEPDPAQVHKALELYLSALRAEPGFAAHYGARLGALTQSLGYAVSPAVQGQLVAVYTHAGRFDEAENWLYRWEELQPDVARGRAETFYRELLNLDDGVLERGGLPRAEVQEGLANVTGTTV